MTAATAVVPQWASTANEVGKTRRPHLQIWPTCSPTLCRAALGAGCPGLGVLQCLGVSPHSSIRLCTFTSFTDTLTSKRALQWGP